MSEKKFYIKFHIFGDNIRGNFGEVDKPLNNTEIVDLLNELSDENRQLRKQVAEYDMILRQYEFAEKEGFR